MVQESFVARHMEPLCYAELLSTLVRFVILSTRLNLVPLVNECMAFSVFLPTCTHVMLFVFAFDLMIIIVEKRCYPSKSLK